MNEHSPIAAPAWLGVALAVGLAVNHPAAVAADGGAILEQQCASCHALQQPDEARLERLWERKGPDLYYAGVKFNGAWLQEWLQHPTRIRPGGELYAKHVKTGADGDVIDAATLLDHPALAAADAQAAAAALLALKGPDGLVTDGAFGGKPVPAAMGKMFFGKLRGCSSCHSIAAGDGGQSGPELGTAGVRLRPDFIYSYIKDPQAIDPHIWMPRQELSEADLQRLTGYLVQQKGTEVAQ